MSHVRRPLRAVAAGPLLALLLAGCGLGAPGSVEPPTATATGTDERATGDGDAGPSGDAAPADDTAPSGDAPGDAGTDGTDGTDDGATGDGGTSPDGGAGDSGGGGAQPGTPPPSGGDAPTTGEQQSPAGRPAPVPAADRGPVGANAPAYLRAGRERLVVEVDVEPGVTLPDGAIAHLRSVLGRESALPVEVVRGSGSGGRERWTVDDLRAFADANRGVRSDQRTAAVYVAVVAGSFERDGVLGVAHSASEVALFPDEWSGLLGGLVAGDAVPRAVLVHEVGHLLGLVGLHQEPVQDHEDPAHPGHTVDRDDVMYWAVETDAVGTVFNGPPPDDFGPFTRADLAAIREG